MMPGARRSTVACWAVRPGEGSVGRMMQLLAPVLDGDLGGRRRALVLVAVVLAAALAAATSASAASSGAAAWGSNIYLPVPVSGLSGVVAVSAGTEDDLALLSDGTVMEWSGGPPAPVPDLSEVVAVSAGDGFNLALLRDGTVMAWGDDDYGELGDGSTEGSATPVPVTGLSEVTAISAGYDSSLALLRDGTVMAWGLNQNGELGDGSFEGPEECFRACSTTPVAVKGLSGVTAIDGGGEHALALLSDGTVMAWGGDRSGQLGDGEEDESGYPAEDEPVEVIGLTDVTAISAGEAFSLALHANGTVSAWGENLDGQLGIGPELNSPFGFNAPWSIPGLSEVTAISAGSENGMALLRDGKVMDWGRDIHGELGIGTTEGPEECNVWRIYYGEPCSNVPVEVSELSGVAGISAGGERGDAYNLVFGPLAPRVTSVSPAAGAGGGGTAVTIDGMSLGEATGVDFGAAEALSFTVTSPTSITAIAPPGTGTEDVTVATPEGVTPTDSRDGFSYGPAVTGIEPDKGPESGGTRVTIRGSDFTEVTAVEFGSTDATGFTVNSPTSITATSPAGSGEVDVTVHSAGGTSPTNPEDRFTYVPPPTVTSLEPARAHSGSRVTIFGANLGEVLAVHFGAASATGIEAGAHGSISALAPAGTGTVDVKVTTPGGTSAVSPDDDFVYVGAPTVASLSPNTGASVGGTTVTITGTNLEDATAVRFGATSADYAVNSATSITAVSPAGSGAVYVTVTTSGGTSQGSRFSYVAPTIKGLSPKKGPAAGGTAVKITGTDLNSATAVDFGANPARSFTVNSTTSITAISPPGAGTVGLTVTTPDGESASTAKDRFKYKRSKK
jgi:hypothetical protein